MEPELAQEVAISKSTQLLRSRLAKYAQKGYTSESILCLSDLQILEPEVPQWPHLRAQLLMRLWRHSEALNCYERATQLYVQQGLLARAIVMAKSVIEIDPERIDVLERLDPEQARILHRRLRPSAVSEEGHCTLIEQAKLIESSSFRSNQGSSELNKDTNTEGVQVGRLRLSDLEYEERTKETARRESHSPDRLAQLPLFPVFAEVPREALIHLATDAELIKLEGGHEVIHKGDIADSLFCIVEGVLKVLLTGLQGDHAVLLAEGDVFGESCLLDNRPRIASVVTEGAVVLLKMNRELLHELAERYPQLRDQLTELLARRCLANLLNETSIFFELDGSARKNLVDCFEVRRANPGTVVIEREHPSDALYIVLSGTFASVGSEGDESDSLVTGCAFGHQPLLDNRPSHLTITATDESLLLRLPRKPLVNVLMENPTILARLSELEYVCPLS